MRRRLWLIVMLSALSACAAAPLPPPAVVPTLPPPVVSLDRRIGAVLRLEDQRWLDDGAGANLLNLVTDSDVRVRRRAATAIGRVGLEAGVPALVGALGDTDTDVRSNAAFGLGLTRSSLVIDPLIGALADVEWSVRARAADALGLVGEALAAKDPASLRVANAIVAMAAGCRASLAALAPDDERWPLPAEIDACRAGLLAITRLRQYDALAKVVLDDKQQPVSTWWPVAFALQRIRDPRAVGPLVALINVDGVNTPALALRGLGEYGDRRGLTQARVLVQRRTADVRVRVAAARMISALKDKESLPTLVRVLDDTTTPPNLALETIAALGAIGDVQAFDVLADRFSHKWAPMRATAMQAAARLDPDAFLLLVSGLAPDADWSVRVALAGVLATLEPDRVRGALIELGAESDARVQAAALEALSKVGAPDLDARLAAALEAPDFNVRATAAPLVAARKITGAAERLVVAYSRGKTDANGSARAAALAALATFGKDAARPTLREALGDADWANRLKAAALLRQLGDATAEPHRPAPLRFAPDYYESPALLRPPYSPHAFIETRYGTIEIELNVVEAPFATQSFVTLARRGYFNGMRIHRVVPNFVVQAGDDRGDGAGGPGYSMRDELSAIPYRRGTVGMALDGADSGGSQFFIAVSPQPHLDSKYAVFGEVVRGMELLDLITVWDVIDRIRVWDGVSF